MTPTQIELVQESWARAAPQAQALAALFYERLFALDPALRPLFRGDMAAQGRQLTTMISYAVRGLNRIEALQPGLEALGRRHAGYGVREDHYATVGEALLATLRQGLGEAFTDEIRQAWASAYAALAAAMKPAPLRRAA